MMKTDQNTVELPLNPLNLAHYFAAIALAEISATIPEFKGATFAWPHSGGFAIYLPTGIDDPKQKLFVEAHTWLTSLELIQSPIESATIPMCRGRMGLSPLIGLTGRKTRPAMKPCAGRVTATNILEAQLGALVAPQELGDDWLLQSACCSQTWRLDAASMTDSTSRGYSSNSEKTSNFNTIFPAIELISFVGASFFLPAAAWQSPHPYILSAQVWHAPISHSMLGLVAAGKVQGVERTPIDFVSSEGATGTGKNYRYFQEGNPKIKNQNP